MDCIPYRNQTASLAIEAAKKALERADIKKEEIGAILAATSTSDHLFPGVACMIQRELGFPEDVTAFDIYAACTGFLFGLQTAQGFLQSMDQHFVLLSKISRKAASAAL